MAVSCTDNSNNLRANGIKPTTCRRATVAQDKLLRKPYYSCARLETFFPVVKKKVGCRRKLGACISTQQNKQLSGDRARAFVLTKRRPMLVRKQVFALLAMLTGSIGVTRIRTACKNCEANPVKIPFTLPATRLRRDEPDRSRYRYTQWLRSQCLRS